MPTLNLKTTHKPIQNYYASLEDVQQLNLLHEGAVAPAFANLLRACCRKMGWTLAEQYAIPRKGRRPLKADGALLDEFKLRRGVWEAKDSQDDLDKEIKKKFRDKYPQDNILFQEPNRAVLIQDGARVFDGDIRDANTLVDVLKLFFEYQPPAYEQWEEAIDEFKDRVAEIAVSLQDLIAEERKKNGEFRDALVTFKQLMRDAINPNLSDAAVEEMLIQHLLTERIFRRVFDNPDFAQRNIIAREIETVIRALTSRHFSRTDFLSKLDRFYGAIEVTAATITTYSEKQAFLNTVYENFFQGFSVKVADTHGIVYTPQPIVDFMVRSVDDILRREFRLPDGLASDDVAILDPFVGTGNFLLRVMRQMPKSRLPHKYANELFCNEVMLLPYYIASMNMEREYYDLTGDYKPFDGIALVDTFELAEPPQPTLPTFAPENVLRVERQKNTPIFVIVGNPPYNAFQVNENDNNRNRKYQTLDQRIAETYAADSTAINKNALSDVYIKAFRWASDRLKQDGVIAFVTNNSFVHGVALDGMRKHLVQDFSAIYHVDLKGNARTTGERRRQESGNVFDDAIRVGVGITFLVRKEKHQEAPAKIYLSTVDGYLSSYEKNLFLEEAGSWETVAWQEVQPNDQNVWITEGFRKEYANFVPLGARRKQESLFRAYSRGVATSRDAWVYDFSAESLGERMEKTITFYNGQVAHYGALTRKPAVEQFIPYNEKAISWSRDLKADLERGRFATFEPSKIRTSLYRPFTKRHLFFDRIFNEEVYQQPSFFPTAATEAENRVICVVNEAQIAFSAQMSNVMPCLHYGGRQTQTFPFYTYDEDGNNRRENITDWAIEQFQTRYGEVTKWQIFYALYAVLHHPTYRADYTFHLRSGLPHIPFVDNFHAFATAGERLAQLHVNYEAQKLYPLRHVENRDERLDNRVQKMRLSKDRTALIYNDFLTLEGIPAETFDYKIGNRSALEWVIDQYRVRTDKRSGIMSDPNNLDDETYIIRLIKQVVTVSVETVEIVNKLPAFTIIE